MTPATAEYDTLADVLGDIPLHRVLWRPYPGTATEADQLRYIERDKRRVELIDGVLVEKAMGFREALLASWIATLLNNFVVPRRLGLVAGADAPMRFTDTRTRLPDVCFVAWGSLPAPGAHLVAVADFAPDLAVEVLSRGNTRQEIEQKRREYFAAGTKLVWVVDRRSETVAVYTDPDTHTVLTTADTLTGDPVLPGFALPVADIFGYLEQLPPDPDPDPSADQ